MRQGVLAINLSAMADGQQSHNFGLSLRTINDSVIADANAVTGCALEFNAAGWKWLLRQCHEGIRNSLLNVFGKRGKLLVEAPFGNELEAHSWRPCSRSSISTGRSGSSIRALAIAASRRFSSQSVSAINNRASFACSCSGNALILAMTSFALTSILCQI